MEKEKNSKITREEALRRLETARKLKREYVAKLEKEMKEEFKKRTGQEATYFGLCKLNCVMLYSHSISSVGERPAPRGGTTRPDERKITII